MDNAKEFVVECLRGGSHKQFFLVKDFYPGEVFESGVRPGLNEGLIRRFLEALPLYFWMKDSSRGEIISEPFYVDADPQVVSISPPPNRIIGCATLESPEHHPAVLKMRVDNIADVSTENGTLQIRSCIHFNPADLNVEGWPSDGMEVDIFTFPCQTRK